jgi:hypothetical protein
MSRSNFWEHMARAQEAINAGDRAKMAYEETALTGLMDHQLKSNPGHMAHAKRMVRQLAEARRSK